LWRTFGQIADVVGTIKSQESISDKAAKLAMGPITAVATGGPLGSRIVRSMDPVQREAKTWVDQARNGAFGPVFGYSDKMPYMRDGYGDPVLIPQAIGADWLNRNIGTWAGAALNLVSPITEVKQQPDRIKDEGARLQVKLPRFPWSLGGKVQDSFDVSTALPGDKLPVELTPQQRDRWQVIYRSNLRHPDNGIEAQLLNTPEWKGETEAAQRELFQGALARAREDAKNQLLAEDTDLAKKALKADASQVLPMLKEADRQKAQGQVGLALDLLDSMAPEARDNLMRWQAPDDSGAQRDNQVIQGLDQY